MKHFTFLLTLLIMMPSLAFSKEEDGTWSKHNGLNCTVNINSHTVIYDVYFDTYSWGNEGDYNDHPAFKETVYDKTSNKQLSTKTFGYFAVLQADTNAGFNPELKEGGISGFPYFFNIIWDWDKKSKRLEKYWATFDGFFGETKIEYHPKYPDIFFGTTKAIKYPDQSITDFTCS